MTSSLFDSELERESYERAVNRNLMEKTAISKAEEKISIAKNMLNMGVSADLISKATELTVDEIERLSIKLKTSS